MDYNVIYGPPGTGKTTELVSRMRTSLDEGIPPERIGFVSFTKAAARELANRVGVANDFGVCSTIHSLAFKLAGCTKDQVIDRSKLKEFSKISGFEISAANPDDADYLCEGDEYLALYQLHGARKKGNFYAGTYSDSNRPGTASGFQAFCFGMDDFKKENGYIDYNDMIKLASKEAKSPEVDVLFIDEAQDLSPLQWRLIYHWCIAIPEVHVAGDDDQAIYVWGGADPQGMSKFEKEWDAQRTVLDKSYRIPKSIHRLSQKVIGNVSDRVDKAYHPRDEEGEIRYFTDANSLTFEPTEDTLILYRNHSLREDIEARLIELCLPYVTDSGKPGLLQSQLSRAIMDWNIGMQNYKGCGEMLLEKSKINKLIRNVKPQIGLKIETGNFESIKDYPWWQVVNATKKELYYFNQIILKHGSLRVKSTIHLSTIHGSKGREANRVVLINGMSQRSCESMISNPDSEYRTFYVGITRAKKQLDILYGPNALGVL